MSVALIFGGGVGSRMGSGDTPKQFLEAAGQPIIVHTIRLFQDSPEISAICVVCLESWIPHLKTLVAKHGLSKVKWMTTGGSSGQKSILNGLRTLHTGQVRERDIVVIHDAVRPLVSPNTIKECIAAAVRTGGAVTVSPVTETILLTDGNGSALEVVERSLTRLARAPQAFRLGDILDAHEQNEAGAFPEAVDSCALMMRFGYPVELVDGPPGNIKITHQSDFVLFRATIESSLDPGAAFG